MLRSENRLNYHLNPIFDDNLSKLEYMPKLSAVVITYNEDEHIEKCLASLQQVADEIIVVDSGSTDETLNIADKFTSNIFFREWEGYAMQKNYAFPLCTNKWVLSLDADEVLSDKLIDEIKEFLQFEKSWKYIGCRIPRKLFIGERCFKSGGFYPDYQLRLFIKNYGRFKQIPVHEYVEVYDTSRDQYVSKDKKLIYDFKQPIKHYSYKSVREYESAHMKFAVLFQKKTNPFFAFVKASYSLLYRFIIRAGFLDGLIGLQLAFIYAKYTFKKYQ